MAIEVGLAWIYTRKYFRLLSSVKILQRNVIAGCSSTRNQSLFDRHNVSDSEIMKAGNEHKDGAAPQYFYVMQLSQPNVNYTICISKQISTRMSQPTIKSVTTEFNCNNHPQSCMILV